MIPSVMAFTGNIAYNCIPLNNITMSGGITRCFSSRLLSYKLACDNRPLTYTTNITYMGCCNRTRVLSGITGSNGILKRVLRRVGTGRPYMNSMECVNLFSTVRLMGSGGAGRPLIPCNGSRGNVVKALINVLGGGGFVACSRRGVLFIGPPLVVARRRVGRRVRGVSRILACISDRLV